MHRSFLDKTLQKVKWFSWLIALGCDNNVANDRMGAGAFIPPSYLDVNQGKKTPPPVGLFKAVNLNQFYGMHDKCIPSKTFLLTHSNVALPKLKALQLGSKPGPVSHTFVLVSGRIKMFTLDFCVARLPCLLAVFSQLLKQCRKYYNIS